MDPVRVVTCTNTQYPSSKGWVLMCPKSWRSFYRKVTNLIIFESLGQKQRWDEQSDGVGNLGFTRNSFLQVFFPRWLGRGGDTIEYT